jgi:type II secretory pathway pseudopilin PulG
MTRIRQRSRRQNRPRKVWGFTLIEVMVIVVVVGIIAIAVGPNLSALFDAVKVKQTVTELRASLQETQRQAIRKNQSCLFEISQTDSKKEAQVNGNCLASGAPLFPAGVSVVTNLDPQAMPHLGLQAGLPAGKGDDTPHSPRDQKPLDKSAKIGFSSVGGAEFVILSATALPTLPTDPSAKIVAYIPQSKSLKKQCVAVSNTLGLTRIGVYTGELSPAAITDAGVCTALDWKEQ